jgi:branched-chain amino acid transport system ATP-binding protein
VNAADPVLEVTDLRKSYGALAAVDGVTFTVARGEMLGVIGPNGAGKTSLMNCLSASPRSDSGFIELNGRSIEKLPAHRRARLGLARTFQRVSLFGEFTAVENVIAGFENDPAYGPLRAVFGARRSKDKAQAEQARMLLASAGLAPQRWDEPVVDLGHGEQRIVELARAMAAQPSVLLLDEPTVGLRDDDVETFGRWLKTQQEAGVAIIVVSHDMRFLLSRSDTVLAMALGKELAYGTPDAVRNDPAVVAAYLG